MQECLHCLIISVYFKGFIKLILGTLVKNECDVLENNRQQNIRFSPYLS